MWKKRYYDEKKKTAPKEEQCSKLRHDLEQWHRRIAGQLEAAKDTGKRIAGHKAYEQAEMKIKSTKYEQEIEELHTKLQNTKLRLTTEIKVNRSIDRATYLIIDIPFYLAHSAVHFKQTIIMRRNSFVRPRMRARGTTKWGARLLKFAG